MLHAIAPVVLWLGLLLLLGGAAAKIVRYARMPMHVRWELYPIPHEGARAAHGGSYLEQLDWWTRPLPHDRGAMLRAMAGEILLLRGVRERNPSLWFWSLPFHFGFYLLAASSLLVAAGGVAETLGGFRLAQVGGWGAALHRTTRFLEWEGPLLALIGTVGLLARRLGDRALRAYTPPAALLNLLFVIGVLGVGLAARRYVDPTAALLRARVGEILTLRAGAPAPALIDLELCLSGLFVGYLPFTFMSHAYMKFFTWHSVRWDDQPRRPGEPTDPRLDAALRRPVGWRAPHMGGGNGRTWGDVVGEDGAPAPRDRGTPS
ncbi:MAG: hypothetical protein ACYDIE_07480 [Candidatus Krumholzibacteriia bacterium]